MTRAFNSMKGRRAKRNPVRPATVQDFSGGLQTVDSETKVSSRFSVKLQNMTLHERYGLINRFGTQLFATVSANAIDITYFNGALIVFLVDGTIEKVTSDGTVTAIWNETIANALPDTPSGWTDPISHISFTEMNGDLIVCNNVDKPVIIDSDHDVTYLQDAASGSNINTPIGKYITTVSDYCVISNVTDNQDLIISNKGTSGTWLGDADPNDSTTFNLGSYVGRGSNKIKGLASFRNRLVVFFEDVFIVVVLGEYDGSGNHVPRVADTVDETGIINHKAKIASRKDLVFMSTNGVLTASQAVFNEAFETDGLSENIDDDLVSLLPNVDQDDNKSFCVVDYLKKKMFFFLHFPDDSVSIYEFSYSKNLKKRSCWNTVTGWSFTGGCSTDLNRVFLIKDDKVWLYGNDVFDDEEFYADFITDANPDGDAVEIDWELPWNDAGQRSKTKKLLRMIGDFEGDAHFTVEIYTDKIRKDSNGADNPALSLDMVASGIGGFGQEAAGFGGGRRASGERSYGLPVNFKIVKIRIKGSVRSKLLMNSLTMLVQDGVTLI